MTQLDFQLELQQPPREWGVNENMQLPTRPVCSPCPLIYIKGKALRGMAGQQTVAMQG